MSSVLAKASHVAHLKRCITGLPASKLDLETSRLGIAYYCLSGLDLLGVMDEDTKVNDSDKTGWRDWIWGLSVQGQHGFGFKPGSFLESASETDLLFERYSPPHLVMTYTALLSLTILRDDFSRLDRPGLALFLRSTQHADGSFSPLPIGTISSESDLRLTFCSFAICSMLDDWVAIDVNKAVEYIIRCRTYEGGYGESPGTEAQGGTTYCALASLHLLSISLTSLPPPRFSLSPSEVRHTLRWLVQKQKSGFQGRTAKEPDACYCFWCGASIKLLGGDNLINNDANATFLSACQYKYGGIAKEPGESSDPYHTYLSLASLSLYPPTKAWLDQKAVDPSAWRLHSLDPLLNLRIESAEWARRHIPGRYTVEG